MSLRYETPSSVLMGSMTTYCERELGKTKKWTSQVGVLEYERMVGFSVRTWIYLSKDKAVAQRMQKHKALLLLVA